MQLIDLLKNRHSEREFTKEVVPLEQVKNILRYTKEYSPSSIGAWQVSFVIVQNKQTLAEIAELTGGQQHIADSGTFVAVVIDFNRTNEACLEQGEQQYIHETTEGLLVGSVDAGLYTMTAQMLIESLGFGTTIIGGIRNNPNKMIELLGLPEKTFPIVGFTIGYKKSTNFNHKPRMSDDSVIFVDKYDANKVKAEIKNYDKVFNDYLKLSGRTGTYSQAVAGFYKQPYYRDVKPTLIKQGFNLK